MKNNILDTSMQVLTRTAGYIGQTLSNALAVPKLLVDRFDPDPMVAAPAMYGILADATKAHADMTTMYFSRLEAIYGSEN